MRILNRRWTGLLVGFVKGIKPGYLVRRGSVMFHPRCNRRCMNLLFRQDIPVVWEGEVLSWPLFGT